MMRNFISVVTRHWISLVGAIIALVAVVLMLTLVGIQMTGFRGGAYLGIVTYMLLPMVFALGLVLIPVGVIRKRQLDTAARAHHEPVPPALPIIDLNNEHTRSVVLASVVVGLLSMVVLAGATYKGVHEMESVAFCGTVCHTVMEPEHTAFQRSPHSKITCADCHIGAGADWFVKSKISGSWQMISVALNLYPRPVTSPVHDLRPARETCEQCHWPTKHVGDKLQVKTKFADDETNTETKTVLVMKVGGQQGSASTGIHWHVDRGVQIRYLTDPTRQHVYDIEMTTPAGKKVYRTEAAPEGPTEWRTMDCVDCHNRPAHVFYPADREVNGAMEDGRIDKTLPFIKREGMRVLQEGQYASKEDARVGIAREVETFYKTSYAELATTKASQIKAAGEALGDIYSWNVFPKMKVTWGTHKNNLGHSEEAPGCFRCHDKRHTTPEGNRIGANCKTCHAVLADEEEDPEILQTLRP
ncbi:MAG: NapC/NirT family cytochrome c [Rubrivivax sp.]|nr:NapC/NirT family cytochrome c [Rubrivivax sp.]